MTQTVTYILYAVAPWVLLLLGLTFCVLVDPYMSRRHRRIILLENVLVLGLLLGDALTYGISAGEPNDFARTCCGIYGYSVRPVLLILFTRMLYPERKQWLLWVPAGLNAAVYLTAFFSGIAFRIADNSFSRGPLGYSCAVLSALLVLFLTVETVISYRKGKKIESVILLFNCALIIAAAAVDMFLMEEDGPVSYLSMAVVGCSIFYYIWLHLQTARKHEEELIENMQAEQRIRIMVSQIQPHFLFNTLSTIQALCMIDPPKAADTVGKFGQYLRQNIDSLSHPEMIPFEKEMEHTRIYSDIEMIRFPSIRVLYDLQDTEFSVPALTVQPLVENAIRHGVRIRSHGEVSVTTRKEGGEHVIVIRDNGRGFDVDAALKADSTHIGMRNVRDRVEQMCGGSMTIDSRIGEGTEITIRLPERKTEE